MFIVLVLSGSNGYNDSFPLFNGLWNEHSAEYIAIRIGKTPKGKRGGTQRDLHICFSFKISYLFVSRKYNSVHLFTQSRSKRYLFTSDEQMKARVNLTQAFVSKRIHIRYG